MSASDYFDVFGDDFDAFQEQFNAVIEEYLTLLKNLGIANSDPMCDYFSAMLDCLMEQLTAGAAATHRYMDTETCANKATVWVGNNVANNPRTELATVFWLHGIEGGKQHLMAAVKQLVPDATGPASAPVVEHAA